MVMLRASIASGTAELLQQMGNNEVKYYTGTSYTHPHPTNSHPHANTNPYPQPNPYTNVNPKP
jgi:hypothetical protein